METDRNPANIEAEQRLPYHFVTLTLWGLAVLRLARQTIDYMGIDSLGTDHSRTDSTGTDHLTTKSLGTDHLGTKQLANDHSETCGTCELRHFFTLWTLWAMAPHVYFPTARRPGSDQLESDHLGTDHPGTRSGRPSGPSRRSARGTAPVGRSCLGATGRPRRTVGRRTRRRAPTARRGSRRGNATGSEVCRRGADGRTSVKTTL